MGRGRKPLVVELQEGDRVPTKGIFGHLTDRVDPRLKICYSSSDTTPEAML